MEDVMSDSPVKNPVGRPRKDKNLGNRDERRYNLALGVDDFESVKRIAYKERTSFLQVAQRFIRIGIMIYDAIHQDNGQVILRTKDKDGQDDDQQILML